MMIIIIIINMFIYRDLLSPSSTSFTSLSSRWALVSLHDTMLLIIMNIMSFFPFDLIPMRQKPANMCSLLWSRLYVTYTKICCALAISVPALLNFFFTTRTHTQTVRMHEQKKYFFSPSTKRRVHIKLDVAIWRAEKKKERNALLISWSIRMPSNFSLPLYPNHRYKRIQTCRQHVFYFYSSNPLSSIASCLWLTIFIYLYFFSLVACLSSFCLAQQQQQ